MDHLAAMVLRVERGRLPVPGCPVAARPDQWPEVLVVEVEGGQRFRAVDEPRRAHRGSERIEHVRGGGRLLQQGGGGGGAVVSEFRRREPPPPNQSALQDVL